MLSVLEGRYTKFCWFSCEWDSRATDLHHRKKKWSLRPETSGPKKVIRPVVVEKSKICLPTLHIKIGLIKIIVKLVSKEGEGFAYLKQKFPEINKAKIIKGIFVGARIKQLL
jgi:hypothetical protein